MSFEVHSFDHFGPSRYVKLAALGARFLPDIILTYGGPETTAAMFMKGDRKLIRFHGQQVSEQGPWAAFARRFGQMHVDRMITPSSFVADGLRKTAPCPVDIVPLGCDEKKYCFKEIERTERPELVIFGRLDPVKGHREFLTIFRRLTEIAKQEKRSVPLLRIVGLPANLSARHILEGAATLGISSQDIEIQCERITDVAALMSRASLGVISSIGSEVICRVAEEFLLCGTPVVTTNVGSLPEIFIDSIFGHCYGDHDNVDGATRIYEELVKSHGESSLDRRARAQLASSHYSIKKMSEALSQTISSLWE
jgi:glycosyltransferase involved in cell wall biosynthesis